MDFATDNFTRLRELGDHFVQINAYDPLVQKILYAIFHQG